MAIVLDAHPDFSGRSYRIARIAESAAVASGMQLVEVEKFHREFDGQNFRVSPWEGHPNEIAHDIFSDMLADVISRSRAIRPYAK